MRTPAIAVSAVTKTFPAYQINSLRQHVFEPTTIPRLTALDNVTLTIQPGEWIAVIGPNGSGKSTLLKLISGLQQPDSGTIVTDGHIASSLDLGTGFHPELTAAENAIINGMLLGMRRRTIVERLPSIMRFAELEAFKDMPLKHFSAGMRLRLGFAIIREDPADIILLDEVLAVGDLPFRHRCLTHLQQRHRQGATIVSVTHNIRLLSQFATRAAYFKRGQLVTSGAPAAVVTTYQNDHHMQSAL